MRQEHYLSSKGIKLLIVIILLISECCSSFATITNQNEVTDLFDKNIKNKKELFETLEIQKQESKRRIEGKENIQSIIGADGVDNVTNELNAIPPNNLENAGRNKRQSEEYRFYDAGNFEPDYTKDGNQKHKEDAKKIVEGTNNKLKEIDHMLKKLGIGDCKTVKGPKTKEPTFYIDVRNDPTQNAEFDQKFCEDLRNSYDCRDTLTLHCVERGIEWKHWQDREMLISGGYIFKQHSNWLHVIRPKKGYWLMHTSNSNDWVKDQVRHYIAGTLGVGVDHIDKAVAIGHTGEGNIYNIREKCHVWDNYRVKYRYRDSKPICVRWDGDQNGWNEKCYLR